MDEQAAAPPDDGEPAPGPPRTGPRRRATLREVKALSHPLRLRILRLCWQQELTNKQLAERLGRDPGTVLYHVRQLVDAGLLEPAPVRTGGSGALEKPYRPRGNPWWLDGPLADADPEVRFAPIAAFQEDLREATPDSVLVYERFMLHLSAEEVAELDRRVLAVLDEYVETDAQRRDRPLVGFLFVLHRLPGAEPAR